VQGVRLSRFARTDIAPSASSPLPDVLPAAAPAVGARGAVAAAEQLLINPLSLASLEQWP
jgi:hypothetical protein